MEVKKIGSKAEFDAECIRIQNEIESLARSICSLPLGGQSWSALSNASASVGEAVFNSWRIEFGRKS